MKVCKIIKVQFVYIVFFTLVSFIACNKKVEIKTSNTSIYDSITHYYNQSRNKDFSLDIRINNINKAYSIVEFSGNDSLKLKIVSYKATLFNLANLPDDYILTAKENLNLALKIKKTKRVGYAYFQIGNYFFKKNISDSAFYYFNKSKEIYKELNDSVNVGRRLLNMAIIQANEGDYYGSESTAIESLKYLDKSQPERLLSLYNCLSITSAELENYNDALYWNMKSEEIQQNDIEKLILKNNRANYNIRKKDYKEAENILTSILENINNIENKQLIANVKSNLGFSFFKQGKSHLGYELLNEALAIRIKLDKPYDIVESYLKLSNFFEETNLSKAKYYSDLAYEQIVQTDNLSSKIEVLKQRMKFAENNELKKLSSKHIIWSDSLQRQQIENRDLFSKIRFETNKNREENLFLKTETAQQELQIEKTRKRNFLLLTSIVIITLLFLPYYVFIKGKQKREKILEVYKTETRMSKKIHDELANDVYNVMTQIQTNDNREFILDNLENLYNRTRDISKQTAAIETGALYVEELKQMLSTYGKDTVTVIIKEIESVSWCKIEKHIKTNLYRVLQELMVNMKKHSKANLVVISFSENKKNVIIEYVDNGNGIDKKKMVFGNGLLNVENRMNSIKGSFKFGSSKGKGMTAYITFSS